MSFYLRLFVRENGHWSDACKEPGSAHDKQTAESEWSRRCRENIRLFERRSRTSITTIF